MKNITIILPIHKFDEDYSVMFQNAISSIEDFHNDVKLTIICPVDVKKEIELIYTNQKVETKILVSKNSSDFCSQVNIGINDCDTEWFSILEIDDEYKPIWIKSMNEYIQSYKDVSVFLPIVKDIDEKGDFVSYTNESLWAYGFTDRQGFLDNEVLLDYQNYQISGGLYKTQIIKEHGLLKENIKLTFAYEWLLRLTYNNVKIMTVPRLGYIHVNFREDSLFWNYKNSADKSLSENEAKFWLDIAKKEYFFKNVREIKYVEQ